MASLIPGYNYDIFISYRQKDNKGDRWVSEFVDALKDELESTFKEEISVYFDINPHDGLLETHDVDESLKEKLKCLVFIPIISRTYCDPKAFAWEHEFKVFVEQASQDQFGLKVKLPNGNVASRVLPVQIHDLDDEDHKLCEGILEGKLRSIEFIYNEPGVDRPLTIIDNEEKNLSKTNYRNQINKVALALKDIITSLKKIDQKDKDIVTKEIVYEEEESSKPRKLGIKKSSIIFTVIIILGIIIYSTSKYFKHHQIRNQVYSEIIPRIDSLYENGRLEGFISDNYWKAYGLLLDAEIKIPGDTNLASIKNKITRATRIISDPPGASVYGKTYSDSDTDTLWHYFGITPLLKLNLPRGSSKIRIVKEGYQEHIDAFNLRNNYTYDTLRYKLLKQTVIVNNMILITGNFVQPNLNGISYLEPEWVGDFLIDKYEVTNEEFMRFIEDGGYKNPKYWKRIFIREGKQLSWEEAMSYFKDPSGHSGPSNWLSGLYPTGEDRNPVSGISWYEAAAYAEYSGKNLPTIYHWSAIFDLYLIPSQAKYSNIENELITPVGYFKGISRHGLYDAVGNVREWIFNELNNKNYIFGGSLKDPVYYYTEAYSTDPWMRDVLNGFRCIKYIDASNRNLLEKKLNTTIVDRSKDKPVSDNEFRLLFRRFSFDKTPVVVKESSKEKFMEWEKEIISLDPAYEGPDLEIHIYLPNNVSPLFQSVIIFPGINANSEPAANIDNLPRSSDYLLRSGRAIIMPKYFSTYGRGPNSLGSTTQEYMDGYVKRVKDLQRTIDYLESRLDIDTTKIAYYGISWGSTHSPYILAIEKRISIGILNAFGLSFNNNYPELYHLNYLPRVNIPILMLSGKYDYAWTYDAQSLFYKWLGTSENDKKWIIDESVHGVSLKTRQYESLLWLDQYFGKAVNQ